MFNNMLVYHSTLCSYTMHQIVHFHFDYCYFLSSFHLSSCETRAKLRENERQNDRK